MNTETRHVSGLEARNIGMQEALSHAVSVQHDWAEQAMNALRVYIGAHPGKEFMTEKVRAYAHGYLKVPRPPHGRAWGGIMVKAARLGLIERVRLGPVEAASSHMANATVWRAA